MSWKKEYSVTSLSWQMSLHYSNEGDKLQGNVCFVGVGIKVASKLLGEEIQGNVSRDIYFRRFIMSLTFLSVNKASASGIRRCKQKEDGVDGVIRGRGYLKRGCYNVALQPPKTFDV